MNTSILLHDFEAAGLVKMTTRRLVRLAKLGEAPCIMLPDGEVRFRESDLRAWVEKYKRPAAEGVGHDN
jgi:hypothetical protein